MHDLLEQTKFVDLRGCCISIFLLSNFPCFILIPISLIFGVLILESLSRSRILWQCKTSIGFFSLKFTPTLMVTLCLNMLLSNSGYQGLFLFPAQPIIYGEVRFPFSSLLTYVLTFYSISPNKFISNLFHVVGCIEKFYRQFGVKHTHHDINYIHNCCSNLSSGDYIKVYQGQLRQILCLPGSNKNSKEEFLMVTENQYTIGMSYPTFSNNPNLQIQGAVAYPFFFNYFFFIKFKVFSTNIPFSNFWCADSRNVKPNLNFV